MAIHSPRRKPKKRLTRKEKGKKKMLEYGTDRDVSDRRESDYEKSEEGQSIVNPASSRKASTLANEQLCQYTRQKNTVLQFGYNEYMAHLYAYMTHVPEVRERESYAEATKDANWRATLEEKMRALAENELWDLVHALKSVKPI